MGPKIGRDVSWQSDRDTLDGRTPRITMMKAMGLPVEFETTQASSGCTLQSFNRRNLASLV